MSDLKVIVFRQKGTRRYMRFRQLTEDGFGEYVFDINQSFMFSDGNEPFTMAPGYFRVAMEQRNHNIKDMLVYRTLDPNDEFLSNDEIEAVELNINIGKVVA